MKTRLAYLTLLALTMFWGGAFVGIKVLLEDLDYVDLTLGRFILSSILLLALLPFFRPQQPLRRPDWILVIFLGALGVGGYHLSLNFGERTVSAGVAALIISAVPVMVAIMASVILNESVSRRRALGIAVALGGVVLLTVKGTPGVDLEIGNVFAAAVTALAPVAWALNTVFSKPLADRIGATPLTILMMLSGTILILPLVDANTFSNIFALDLRGWLWLAYLVIPCTVGGYLAWFWGLRHLGATRTAAFVYVVPLWALGWAAVVLEEALTGWTLVGGTLVLSGVYLVEGRRKSAVAFEPSGVG